MPRAYGDVGAVSFGARAPPEGVRRARCTRALGLLLISVLLAACHAEPQARPVLRRCLVLAGATELAVDVPAAGPGLLAIAVQERGITATASLAGGARAASPIDRLGRLYLSAPARGAGTVRLSLRAQDSPGMSGPVCLRAELIPPGASLRAQAVLAAAAGAQAVERSAWHEAFDSYQRAARIFDALRLPAHAAEMRHALAEIAYRRFDPRDGYALAGFALSGLLTAGPSSDRLEVAELVALQAKALLDARGGEAQGVAPEVRHRLAVAREQLGSDPQGSRELPRLEILDGFLQFLLNDIPAARQHFQSAARRCGDLRDWECYAIASQNLAQLAEEDANFPLALSIYADVLRLIPPELDPKLVATIWTNLARLQRVTGLVGESRRSSASALRIYARIANCDGLRLSLLRSGQLPVQVGTLADAGRELQEAAAASCAQLLARDRPEDARSKPWPPAAAAAASPAADASDRDRCTDPLSAVGLTSDNKGVVFDALLSLAEVLRMRGDLPGAQRCLGLAAAFVVGFRDRIGLASARGEALLQQGDAAGARSAFAAALSAADTAGVSPLQEQRAQAQLGLSAALLRARDPRDALLWSGRSLHSGMARGDVAHVVRALHELGRSYRELGDPQSALRTLRVAADLVDAIPIAGLDGELRASFLATQHAVFAELTDLYGTGAATDSAQAWLAFESADRGTARSLRYALSQATGESGAAGTDMARYARIGELMAQGGASPDEDCSIEACIAPLERITAQLALHAERVDPARLHATLRGLGATLLEYAVGSRDLFAFLVQGEDVHVVRLAPLAQVMSAAGELRERVQDPDASPQAVHRAAAQLAAVILWPLATQLRTPRILIVPADAVHTVPLALLPVTAQSDDVFIAHYAPSIVPSAQWLTEARAAASGRRSAARLALLGDPVFRPSEWGQACVDPREPAAWAAATAVRSPLGWAERLPRLPGSRVEVEDIARLAGAARPGSRVESLLGCAATPRALRTLLSSPVDLLHLATHARLDSERPRLSAFALTPEAGQGPQSGELSLLDVLGLHLTGTVVVLSACETSSGRLLAGEGVLGPAQAFLQAGAASVLGSYWRVDDRATVDFMHAFYAHLLRQGMSVAAALQATQLERAARSPPRDWAAFAAYGWPESRL